MDVSIEKKKYQDCNFCLGNKDGQTIISFSRHEGNGFVASICEKCLEELNSKYHQLINDKN